jgi:hypothetical protein
MKMMTSIPTTYEAQNIDILSERAAGRCDSAGINYYMLSRSIDTNKLRDIPALLAEIIEHGAWKKWRWVGSDFTAASIDEYVTVPPPRGLGASVGLIQRLLADHPKALEAFERERRGERAQAIETQPLLSVGRPSDADNVDTKKRDVNISGNSNAYAIARLRRDRPDIHARVLAGELTPNAGMIEAGFRKKRPSTKRNAVQQIEKLWATLTSEEKQSVRNFIDADK